MKNILKTTILSLMLISLGSCTNEKNPVTSANGFKFRDISDTPSPAILFIENQSQVYKKLEWDRADYGVPTFATYKIVITDHDNDPNFLEEVEYDGIGIDPNGDARKASLSVGEFNNLINKLSTYKCGVMNIDIRVKSILGTSSNKQIQYTEPKTVSVTGYTTKPKVLSFSNVTNTTFTANLASSGFKNVNDYEGYLYLEPGDYKFYQPDACGSFTSPIVYGGIPNDETKEIGDGTVVAGVDAPSINIATAGYYYITVDLTPSGLKYNAQFYKAFGVFGLAVRNNPGSLNMVPMEDINNSNIWTIIIELFKGRVIKFKSNDWTAPLTGNPPGVPSTNATTKLISTLGGVGTTANDSGEIPLADFGTGLPGKDIVIPGTNDATKQKYKITIDVSKPRNYTYKLELVE